ncbi:15288_t:CDS:2 [Cetraspora pellucida]|uniref:15288_t:CDS:1 n=1 Tax=Cetraspora pellucida TaxID=1433469 RepID=A0A9N9H893_9GLOM|nr:15288_t:CDS:2 [Cetraspora pellucida]
MPVAMMEEILVEVVSPSSWVDRKNIKLCGDGPEKSQELSDDKLSFTFQKKDGLYFKFEEESFGLDNIIRNKGCDTWVLREFKFRLKYEKDVLSEHAG